MYLAINGASSTVGVFNKISIFKYLHSAAKLVNAKMIGAPGEVLELKEMIINKNTGDQFYAGKIQASKILQNAGEMESFVIRLNNNMDYVFFRTFQGSTNAYASTMVLDSNVGVYVQIRE